MEIERRKALEIRCQEDGKLPILVIIRNIMWIIIQIRHTGFILLRQKPYHQDGSKVIYSSFIVVVMNVTSYSDEIRYIIRYARMRTNDYLVLSKDFGVYYVNHVEKKTQYEAPTCRALQIAKRNSQTTPPIPESQDSQFMGKYTFLIELF